MRSGRPACRTAFACGPTEALKAELCPPTNAASYQALISITTTPPAKADLISRASSFCLLTYGNAGGSSVQSLGSLDSSDGACWIPDGRHILCWRFPASSSNQLPESGLQHGD
ncbi:hypothetical protein WJX84_008084 [Apatococcus fuscideae]|uniref:Uncharacterized protein n=1 Tax=Apatococcus fuscideae TaxID=2026836 RepID=A0AAW1ST66_9CHLO